MRRVDNDGVSIAYQTIGSGRPIVLVAGFTADHTYWDQLAALLADERQVITLDNRGVGESDDPEDPYSMNTMATDVLTVTNALGLDSFDLVGQSMGTSIAMTLASTHSERVNRLALLNGYRKIRPVFMAVVNDALERLRSGGSRADFVRQLMPWSLGDKSFCDPDQIEQLVTDSVANPAAPSLNALQLHATVLRDFDAQPLLSSIPHPTLLVATNQDIVSLPTGSIELAEGLANANVTLIDGPHDVTVEQPRTIYDILDDFLPNQ